MHWASICTPINPACSASLVITSTATGLFKRHEVEQDELINSIFGNIK